MNDVLLPMHRWTRRTTSASPKKEPPVNAAANPLDLDNTSVLAWLAETFKRVQKRRKKPTKRGRLHRV